MRDEDDEIIMRIGADGKIEYGIPVSKEDSEIIKFFAELKGITFDEAAHLLVTIGFEGWHKQFDNRKKSQNNNEILKAS